MQALSDAAVARVREQTGAGLRSEGIIAKQVSSMKTVLIIVGVMIFLCGGVWFLQGINILPGSFMTGQPEWAIIGAISMTIGTGLVVWSVRRNQPNG